MFHFQNERFFRDKVLKFNVVMYYASKKYEIRKVFLLNRKTLIERFLFILEEK